MEKYHLTPQALIDWFKNNLKTKDFGEKIRKQVSPRAKVPTTSDMRLSEEVKQTNMGGSDWDDVAKEWRRQGGSVHSLNDDVQMQDETRGSNFRQQGKI